MNTLIYTTYEINKYFYASSRTCANVDFHGIQSSYFSESVEEMYQKNSILCFLNLNYKTKLN